MWTNIAIIVMALIQHDLSSIIILMALIQQDLSSIGVNGTTACVSELYAFYSRIMNIKRRTSNLNFSVTKLNNTYDYKWRLCVWLWNLTY